MIKWTLAMDRPERVAFIGPGRHTNWQHVIEYSKTYCDVVHVYDKDPHLHIETEDLESVDYTYCCVDVIFDEVELADYDLIVVFSQEKMFPLPKRYYGNFILVFSLHPHNGNCTDPAEDLGLEIEENYLFPRHRVISGRTRE